MKTLLEMELAWQHEYLMVVLKKSLFICLRSEGILEAAQIGQCWKYKVANFLCIDWLKTRIIPFISV
jgi:hypothetical protein